MSVIVKDLVRRIEEWLPKKYSEKGDRIGFQLGSYTSMVNKIMVTLDLDERVVNEAIDKNVDFIFTHHTPMFSKIDNLVFDTFKGRIYEKLIKNDIALYCAHTNLDSAYGGVNDVLADRLGLKSVKNLSTSWKERFLKFAVYVPKNYEESIRKTLSEAGAGRSGNYSDTSFHSEGRGYFKPLEGTEPYLGKVCELTEVDEVKIETIVSNDNLEKVLRSVLEAHPYEEPAYDIIPLYIKANSTGLGRIGYLKEPVKLKDFLEQVSIKLDEENLKYVGDIDRHIYKVALCGGSGMSLYSQALASGADVFITGDVKYHDAQDAYNQNLAIIDAGHYSTEKPVVGKVAMFLKMNFSENLEIITSEINTNPFNYYKR